MRQLTTIALKCRFFRFSKLPMRQLTRQSVYSEHGYRYKLPMRQLTLWAISTHENTISKLPMRQLTRQSVYSEHGYLSKLPMRQLTVNWTGNL